MPIGVHGLEVPWAVGNGVQKSADDPTKFVCPFTKKKFKTKATYENYLASKKYKDLVAANAQAAKRAELHASDGVPEAAGTAGTACEQLVHTLAQLTVSSAAADAAPREQTGGAGDALERDARRVEHMPAQ